MRRDVTATRRALRELNQHLRDLIRVDPAEASGLVVVLCEATREAQRRAAHRLQATDPATAAVLRMAAGEDTPPEGRS